MSQQKNSEEDVLIFSTLSILQLIKECQLQHGLRHGDYQRYRAYCARKLQRVRKSMKLTHHHRGKSFQYKDVTPESVKLITVLLLPLFDAERCWSYAMQLKQEANSEPRKKFHIARRMRKAVEHSGRLESLCRTLDAVDARTKLESQAYHAWMQGNMFFEDEQWQQSLEAFKTASTIYEKLASAVAVSDAELQALYKQRCQEVVPQMRYCQYNIGDSSAAQALVDMRGTLGAEESGIGTELDALIAQTRLSAQAAKPEVTWCGHRISTERPANSMAFISSISSLDDQLKNASDFETKVSVMERFVMDCRDVLQAVRDEFKNENFRLVAGGDEEDLSNAQLLYSYLNYIRLSKTVDRYLLMIGNFRCSVDGENGGDKKSARPQDFVRLYDAVLQNLSEVEMLPGVAADQGFVQSLRIRTAFYKAFRCYYILESLRSSGKWEETYVLARRGLEYVVIVKDGLNKGVVVSDVTKERVAKLEQRLNTIKYTAYANCLVDDDAGDVGGVPSDSKVVIEQDGAFRRLTPADITKGRVSLVSLPPDFRPTPAKPLFYDLALNHVSFPTERMKEKIGVEEKSKTGGPTGDQTSGLTGFVKGWIWGKK